MNFNTLLGTFLHAIFDTICTSFKTYPVTTAGNFLLGLCAILLRYLSAAKWLKYQKKLHWGITQGIFDIPYSQITASFPDLHALIKQAVLGTRVWSQLIARHGGLGTRLLQSYEPCFHFNEIAIKWKWKPQVVPTNDLSPNAMIPKMASERKEFYK